MPPGAKVVPLPDIPPGSLTPTVYSYITSSIPGEVLSACVGIGLSDGDFGLIYEYSHRGSAQVAEEIVRRMIEEGFKKRNLKLAKLTTVCAEHKVERIGCAVAAAVLWWEED